MPAESSQSLPGSRPPEGAPRRVPLVAYLALEPEPHLLAWECAACAARFFDRRNACAACGLTSFAQKPVSTTGQLRAFSVVHRASPKVKVPFVAAVVEADDGTTIRSNLLVEPDPSRITLPMSVRLATYSVGTDSSGAVCVAFGFSPSEAQPAAEAQAQPPQAAPLQSEHEKGEASENTPAGVT